MGTVCGADDLVEGDEELQAEARKDAEDELIHVEILHRHGDRTPIYFLQKEAIEAQIWIPMIAKEYKCVEYDATNGQVTYSADEKELFSWQFINDSMLKNTVIVSTDSKEDIDAAAVFTTNIDNKVPWCGLLTNAGVAQLKEAGQYLRGRYIDELGFFPDSIDGFEGNIYYQSTNDARNIYSAAELLTTLYPDITDISSYDERIPIYIDREADAMFGPFDSLKVRPQWKALLGKNEKRATNELLHPQLEQVTNDVLAKFDKNMEGNTGEIFFVQDAYTCLADHANDDNPVIVQQKEDNVIDVALAQQLKALAFKQTLYGISGDVRKDKESLRGACGALLSKIYNNLKTAAARKDDDGTPKCRMYSVHDETLTPLLCALNNEMQNIMDLADRFEWPPYGVTLCFEVWQKNDANKTRYVKVRYDKKETTINGQSGMDLDNLYSFWKGIMDPDPTDAQQ